jgi:hypothetical protein
MKKLILFLALFSALSFAQEKGNNNGLGLWLSNYGWGIDLKHLNKGEVSVWDVYLSGFRFSSTGHSSFGMDVGYYFLYPKIIKADASMGRFPLHWGPNIGAGFWTYGDKNKPGSGTHLVIAPNIALGISWFIPTSFKWDVSLELFPGLRVDYDSQKDAAGESNSNIDLSLGVDLRFLVHFYLF